MLDMITGIDTSSQKWSSTYASVGVGDSATAADPTQTNLVAASNKTYKTMDSTYPKRTTQVMVWQGTFASADANYAWQEYVVANHVDGTGVCLNRVVNSKGTKVSGETWVLQIQITGS